MIKEEKEAIELLRKVAENGDTEVAHSQADRILCDFLESLGYHDLVVEYDKIDKWFS